MGIKSNREPPGGKRCLALIPRPKACPGPGDRSEAPRSKAEEGDNGNRDVSVPVHFTTN